MSTPPPPPFLETDGSSLDDPILNYGSIGVVILRNGEAVKLPRQHSNPPSPTDLRNRRTIRHEQRVYRRLGASCPGVVPCLGIPSNGDSIRLAYLRHGNLIDFLENRPPMTRPIMFLWFQDLARALATIHDHRVLMVDLACRNILVDDTWHLKLCDFGGARIFPLHVPIPVEHIVDEWGFSIYTDMAALGAVMYEVVAGTRCEIDFLKDQTLDDPHIQIVWPSRGNLPSTRGLWLGEIMDRCWTPGGFRNAWHLLQVLVIAEIVEKIERKFEGLG